MSEQMQGTEDERTTEIRRSPEWLSRSRRTTAPERASEAIDDDLLARLARVAELSQRELDALPCRVLALEGKVYEAAKACDLAGAAESCSWKNTPDMCPREQRAAHRKLARANLAKSGVPAPLVERILLAIPGGELPPQKLLETDSLKLVRAWLTRTHAPVLLSSGERIPFMGNEWCLAISGRPGCGKSLAAGYAIARGGGRWLRARDISNPKFPLADLRRAPLLVVDDVGTEYGGASNYGPEQLAGLLEERADEELFTLLTLNMDRRCQVVNGAPVGPPQFAERYGERVDDRMRRGRFAVVGDGSLRNLEVAP